MGKTEEEASLAGLLIGICCHVCIVNVNIVLIRGALQWAKKRDIPENQGLLRRSLQMLILIGQIQPPWNKVSWFVQVFFFQVKMACMRAVQILEFAVFFRIETLT